MSNLLLHEPYKELKHHHPHVSGIERLHLLHEPYKELKPTICFGKTFSSSEFLNDLLHEPYKELKHFPTPAMPSPKAFILLHEPYKELKPIRQTQNDICRSNYMNPIRN